MLLNENNVSRAKNPRLASNEILQKTPDQNKFKQNKV